MTVAKLPTIWWAQMRILNVSFVLSSPLGWRPLPRFERCQEPLVAGGSLLLGAMPGAPSSVLAPRERCQEPLVASLLLGAMPGAPSSVLAPRSDARSP